MPKHVILNMQMLNQKDFLLLSNVTLSIVHKETHQWATIVCSIYGNTSSASFIEVPLLATQTPTSHHHDHAHRRSHCHLSNYHGDVLASSP